MMRLASLSIGYGSLVERDDSHCALYLYMQGFFHNFCVYVITRGCISLFTGSVMQDCMYVGFVQLGSCLGAV